MEKILSTFKFWNKIVHVIWIALQANNVRMIINKLKVMFFKQKFFVVVFLALNGFQQKPDFVVSMPKRMTAAVDSAFSMFCGAKGKCVIFFY